MNSAMPNTHLEMGAVCPQTPEDIFRAVMKEKGLQAHQRTVAPVPAHLHPLRTVNLRRSEPAPKGPCPHQQAGCGPHQPPFVSEP